MRGVLPLAFASARRVLRFLRRGAIWFAPPLVAALVLAFRRAACASRAPVDASAPGDVGAGDPASIVAAITAASRNAAGSSSSDRLRQPVRPSASWLQVFGIWPNGDFRSHLRPGATYVLIS